MNRIFSWIMSKGMAFLLLKVAILALKINYLITPPQAYELLNNPCFVQECHLLGARSRIFPHNPPITIYVSTYNNHFICQEILSWRGNRAR